MLKAAKALGYSSEDEWLDHLRKSDFVRFQLSGSARERLPNGEYADSESGLLSDAVKHSITLCHILEAERAGPPEPERQDSQPVRLAETPPLTADTTNQAQAENEPASRRKKRLRATVYSPVAARRMEAYMESHGGQTKFAVKVGTTDRTLRSFRESGRVRRDIFDAIAGAMQTTPDDLLKPE